MNNVENYEAAQELEQHIRATLNLLDQYPDFVHDRICQHYLTIERAKEFLLINEAGPIGTVSPAEITDLLTFEESHIVAKLLVDLKRDVAVALYEELRAQLFPNITTDGGIGCEC